ncbi:hypothetical protein BD310DRAFT_365384 [Dichomitus squalens]|uniref:Uncharacterized protein n=1 Tax=Dichomitus squalens TaxID=114155 RepID=A0A4Q9PYS5_9APHY|nr:hypothetical protein BD310DRAFT_365384 [Dichomitus squalens]
MSEAPKIVDNTDPHIPFFINAQYVNVTDIISDQAYAYVQAAIPSAHNKSVADITVPKWSFQYQFTGTRISLYGVVIPWISGALPTAQYAVDGQSQNISSAPNTTRTLLGVNFYTSDWFPNGTHMLTVNVTTATEDGPYLFDYLSIDTTNPPAANNTAATNSTASASSSSTSTTSSSSSTASSSGTALGASTHSKSSVPIAPLVGGVIGGLALLALIAFGAWWMWKKHRTEGVSTYAYARTGQYDGHTPHVDPFTVYRQADSGSTPVTMADGSYYSDPPPWPPNRVPTPAAASSHYSSEGPPQSSHTQSAPSGSRYGIGNEAGALYGAAAAGAIAAPGAIMYSTGSAGGKAAEARMEALPARQRPVSDLGSSDLSAATSSVPPPYAP